MIRQNILGHLYDTVNKMSIEIPEKIEDDSHLVSLAQTLVFSSQDATVEFLERLHLHSSKFPAIANVLLFTMFGKFFHGFCELIEGGNEDLHAVVFEAINGVMTDPKFEEFMATIALNPFIVMSGSGE